MSQQDHIKTALRVPPELHADLHEAARLSGRSYNAEILHRLSQTFEDQPTALPQAVKDALEDEVEARGGTPEEALVRLVLLGQTKGGTVFQVSLQPGAKLQDLKALLEAARHVIPPDADMIVVSR